MFSKTFIFLGIPQANTYEDSSSDIGKRFCTYAFSEINFQMNLFSDFEEPIDNCPIDLNGIVRFFIKDLLKYIKQDNYFIVRDIPFIYIEICGVIIDKHIIRNNISIKG